MWPAPVFASAALALIVERFAGYPKPVYDKIGHPVEWIGSLIGWADRKLNRQGANRAEGRLRFTSARPSEPPRIESNLFGDERDRASIRER